MSNQKDKTRFVNVNGGLGKEVRTLINYHVGATRATADIMAELMTTPTSIDEMVADLRAKLALIDVEVEELEVPDGYVQVRIPSEIMERVDSIANDSPFGGVSAKIVEMLCCSKRTLDEAEARAEENRAWLGEVGCFDTES